MTRAEQIEAKVREMIDSIDVSKSRSELGPNSEIESVFVEVELMFVWDLAKLLGAQRLASPIQS